MGIRVFVVLLLLVPTLPHAANACGKLQPTLKAYYVQEYGDDYLKGIVSVPTPEEGAKCTKLRYDMRYWHCLWKGAYQGKNYPHPSKLANSAGIPHDVVRWRAVKASQVGGEASKQKLIRRGWERYREAVKHHAESEARQAAAKAGYLAARSKSKASGCKVGIFGRYGKSYDGRPDPFDQ